MSNILKNMQKQDDTAQKTISGLPTVKRFFESRPVPLSITDIAKIAGVSKTAAYQDIRGIKPSPRFRKKVKRLFGSIPWE